MGRKNKRKKVKTKRLPSVSSVNKAKRNEYRADQKRRKPPPDGEIPKRMEIWYANLPLDTKTSVQGGQRPVLIMSNDTGNQTSRTVTVLPMTSKMKHPNMPTHVYIPPQGSLSSASMILAEQITTLDKSALDRKLAVCSEPSMVKRVEKAVSEQLGLDSKLTETKNEEMEDKDHEELNGRNDEAGKSADG